MSSTALISRLENERDGGGVLEVAAGDGGGRARDGDGIGLRRGGGEVGVVDAISAAGAESQGEADNCEG